MNGTYANPHLRCGACGQPAPGYAHVSDAVVKNLPCGHITGVSSSCLTWSPKTGCRCETPCTEGVLAS